MAVSSEPSRISLRRLRLRWPLLAGLVLLLAAVGFFAARSFAAARYPGPPSHKASAADIEQKWGIRITQVAVTADGGMVDFRYQVIDPEKAINLTLEDKQGDIPDLPVLVAEDNGGLINSAAQMAAKHDIRAGQTYFLLYRNNRGAVKSGSTVSVIIGDQRLEHVAVQ